MSTDEADEGFDDAAWHAALCFVVVLPFAAHRDRWLHRDFWRMYCMGGEL